MLAKIGQSVLRPSGFRIGLRQMSSRIEDARKVGALNQVTDNSESTLNQIFEKAAEYSPKDGVDWDISMEVIKRTENILPSHKPTKEELEDIRASRPTVSLASLVNESETLQKLVDLGVKLSYWDNSDKLGLAVKLDFDRDVAPVVRFLADFGVPHDKIGNVLTRGADLLETPEEDLMARTSYLISKKFTKDDIATIIVKDPHWLLFKVKGIDGRLGFLQKTFSLTGPEMRALVLRFPRLVTIRKLVDLITKKNFTFKEEMGFEKAEMKRMLLTQPEIYTGKSSDYMVQQFNLLHNEAGITHEVLAEFPTSLRRSPFVTGGRIQFLTYIKRDQFCPTLPNYVSPDILTDSPDEEFCEFLGCELDFFHKFLRTI